MALILFFQYETISWLLNVDSHSLILLNPSYFERFIMIFFECLCNLLFRVLNISSIGAHPGEYGAKNITFQPLLLSSSIDFLDLCMGQLSRIMTVLCSSIHRSSSIHLESFWIYSTKFDILLAPTKFVVNQLPFEVIAHIIKSEPLNEIFHLKSLLPLLSQE